MAHQAPLSTEFSRQEQWSGLPFPAPGALPNPGIKHTSPALQADSLPSEPPGKPIVSAKLASLMISQAHKVCFGLRAFVLLFHCLK